MSPASGKPAKASEEMIDLFTVNGRKFSCTIPLKRYEAMCSAVLRALQHKPDGLSLSELAHAAAVHLPKWWTDEKWDEMWHTTAVKLHLEYLGELERVPKVSPHRVRFVAVGSKHASTASTRVSAAQGGKTAGAKHASLLQEKEIAELEAAAIEAAPITMKRPKSPGEMHAAMKQNLPLRTGRSLGEWIQILREEGLNEINAAEKWLKTTHGLSSMYAGMVAGAALGGPAGIDYGDQMGLLDSLYSGEREKLRPVYEKLRAAGLKLGPEVQEVVCKTYTSLRGNRQFAVIMPTTRTLLDIGLALPPDTVARGRLESCRPVGGGERNKHRIRLSSVKEIDAEVKGWLKAAYDWNRQA